MGDQYGPYSSSQLKVEENTEYEAHDPTRLLLGLIIAGAVTQHPGLGLAASGALQLSFGPQVFNFGNEECDRSEE